MNRKRKKRRVPTVIDVYCGAGGLSLGAARAGFDVRVAVDLDQRALATHHRNFPDVRHIEQNVATLRGRNILDIGGLRPGELIGLVGGPPCQGFSVIGARERSDPRNDMFGQFIRLVREIRPAFFMIENVPGILDKRYKRLLRAALDLVPKRYEVLEPFAVQANDYGAPTIRTRVIFFGFDPKRFADISATDFEAAKVPDTVNVRAALNGLPVDIAANSIDDARSWRKVRVDRSGLFFDRISGHIPTGVGDPAALKRFERDEVHGNLGTRHSSKLARRYGSLAYGEIDPITKSVRLDPEGFCPTLRAGTGPEKGSFQAVRPIHYLRPRVITPREAARLQGFPDWFVLDRTKWHSFRQLGNSVSPIVAERLLQVAASAIRN